LIDIREGYALASTRLSLNQAHVVPSLRYLAIASYS